MAYDNNNLNKHILDFKELDESTKELIQKAVEARNYSYSPYSNFAVGAALRTDTGKIYTGCNVESKVYTPTICAERTAICKFASEGHRKLTSIAVVAYQENCFTTPCGVCREVLSEFGEDDLSVYMSKPDMKQVLHLKLSQLLPLAYKP